MRFRFHVYQQVPTGRNIEPRLSGAPLEHQYEQLLPTLRSYCAGRRLNVTVAADPIGPKLEGRIITVSGDGLRKDQAEALMGEFLRYLNRLVRNLDLVAGLLP